MIDTRYKQSLENKYNLKIFTDNIEYACLNQIKDLLELDVFKDCKVRVMPDTHAGKGCVIGFTADLGNKVIPNIVGVDIGCGMLTIELGDIDIDFEDLDKYIREKVPCGFAIHSHALTKFPKLQTMYCYNDLTKQENFEKGIGSLGGGNHFIEIDKDEEDIKYLVIHSGSRNLGNQVAQYYQNKAIQRNLENIPKDLCYLENEDKNRYLNDMQICQEYAHLNRLYIANIILNKIFGKCSYTLVDEKNTDIKKAKQSNISISLPYFETIHNYISFKDNIVRKGAVSAYKDEKLIIPINMRDGSLLCIGKGNEDWNNSAPHGAGRIMSRGEAKRTFQLDEFVRSMQGIYTTSVSDSTIDEAPFVYKPMQEILDNIKDSVDVIKIIKPIYNFKAN